jgi:hypothetical protein
MSDVEAPPDLALCDREPITRLERIPSFGFLLAMSTDWTVVRASATLGMLLDVEAAAAIGAKLDDLIDRVALHDIRNRMGFLVSTQGIERLYPLYLRNPFRIVADVNVQRPEADIHRREQTADTTAFIGQIRRPPTDT